MKIYLISDNNDTLTGMRLVGVKGSIVHTKEELAAAFQVIDSDPEIGIVLIMENLAKSFPDLVYDRKITKFIPLVVEIPDRHGTGRAPDFITEYVREAIGVKLGK